MTDDEKQMASAMYADYLAQIAALKRKENKTAADLAKMEWIRAQVRGLRDQMGIPNGPRRPESPKPEIMHVTWTVEDNPKYKALLSEKNNLAEELDYLKTALWDVAGETIYNRVMMKLETFENDNGCTKALMMGRRG